MEGFHKHLLKIGGNATRELCCHAELWPTVWPNCGRHKYTQWRMFCKRRTRISIRMILTDVVPSSCDLCVVPYLCDLCVVLYLCCAFFV